TLVMQLVDHGTPASTRIYTVAADRTTMTETKAFYGHDGTPILQTNLVKRIPERRRLRHAHGEGIRGHGTGSLTPRPGRACRCR
ncbi:hypothetical protein ABTD78_22605, partial [Acinetobacter baumannii]